VFKQEKKKKRMTELLIFRHGLNMMPSTVCLPVKKGKRKDNGEKKIG
jgi:hypothetical protein